MSVLPEISNPYVGAVTLGLVYGTVFCTSTCLPHIASYIAGVGAGFRRGVAVTFVYNAGRVIAYAIVGGLVGIISGVFKFIVSESFFSVFQQYASYVFGTVTVIIGVSILLRSRSAPEPCKAGCIENPTLAKRPGNFDLRAFSLGFTRGLAICPYLVAILLLYALPLGTPIDGFIVSILFGLGTALSPLLLLGGVTGWLLNKAHLFRRWISVAGGLMLIILGILTSTTALF